MVQNLGDANPGPFRVRFVLVGASGDITHGIFLGDTMVAGLAPGAATVVSQTDTLPLRLPADVTLSSLGVGRIAVIVDPENVINESFKNNNTADSGPVTLRLLGTDGSSYVPNLPSPAQTLAGEGTRRTRESTKTDHREGALGRQAASSRDRRRSRAACSTP